MRGSLSTLLYGVSKIKLNKEQKILFCHDVVKAMQYLHHGVEPPIVHRDLKPGNIRIDMDWKAKVADFGISKVLDKTTKTMTLRGTVLYLSPEIILSSRYSEKSDVFAFGITLCELFTERVPYTEFPGENIPRLLIKIAIDGLRPTNPEDKQLASLTDDCVAQESSQRPTFAEIEEKLRNTKVFDIENLKEKEMDDVSYHDPLNE